MEGDDTDFEMGLFAMKDLIKEIRKTFYWDLIISSNGWVCISDFEGYIMIPWRVLLFGGNTH